MREFERFNTVCANAYVRPQMKDYLSRLGVRLTEAGANCPLYMIHSGGGLISVETAIDFPVRLVESGPAGGAIFAADFAAKLDQQRVLSYDMGGTTAKICLIDDEKPKTSRSFEVARTYRFKKGSGMPISIPVIEMVEIGAGGGSLASLDALGRIQVGPESAASEPGPACYGRGGDKPAVTDGDVMLGKIDPDNFAGGEIRLCKDASKRALEQIIANPLDIEAQDAAFGVVEMVDENMANAARVHAVESGKNIADYSMIAFGGAAPLHAARLCEKLNIDQCIIPPGAGVGSAIGFLRAPFAYEAVQSLLLPLSKADMGEINRMLAELVETAQSFVLAIDKDVVMETELTLFMRYAGQGWEIPVEMPCREMSEADRTEIQNRFHEAYARFFGRTIDALEGLEIEIVSWSVKASTLREEVSRIEVRETGTAKQAPLTRKVFDPRRNEMMDYAIIERSDLGIGEQVNGPAVVVERETSVVVTSSFDVIKQGDGSLLLIRKSAN
jgi:N-methylhydantoinase A